MISPFSPFITVPGDRGATAIGFFMILSPTDLVKENWLGCASMTFWAVLTRLFFEGFAVSDFDSSKRLLDATFESI